MSDRVELKRHLLERVDETHERFCELMEERLQAADVELIERYFGLLSKLVDKLDEDEKTLRQVAQEMVAESAAQIIAELA